MTLRDWTVLGVIVFIAAGLRLAALDSPERLVLDEFWYARDGCYYWRGAEAECGLANLVAPDRDVDRMLADYGELTPEHPPLGKLLIGAPMKAFGFSPRSWRLAAALAGVLMVALLFLFVKRALGSTTAAAGASLLLAIDYPHFIHSRLGMLDIFVGLFALAAFYFCLLDHAQTESRAAGTRSHYGWRLAAGLAAGAATASKLSGAAVVLGVLGLVIASEATVRRRRGPPWERLGASAASIFLLLLVVPLGVYLATYAGRLDGSLLALPWDEGAWPRSWVERQADMVQLQADKPSSPASRWSLPMTEPPLPYVLEPSGENVRELLLFGNPLLWWGGFAAVALAALRWRKDGFTAGVIVVGFFSAFAGWLFLTVTRSPVHLYHAVPVIPFLYLALAYLFEKVAAFRVGRVTSIVVFAVSIGAFAFYLPILTAWEIDRGQWRPRACSAQVLWLDPKPECGLRAAKSAVGPRLGKPFAATGSGRVAAAALLLHRDMGTRGLASALIRPRPPESHPSASAADPASARTESGKPADRQAPRAAAMQKVEGSNPVGLGQRASKEDRLRYPRRCRLSRAKEKRGLDRPPRRREPARSRVRRLPCLRLASRSHRGAERSFRLVEKRCLTDDRQLLQVHRVPRLAKYVSGPGRRGPAGARADGPRPDLLDPAPAPHRRARKHRAQAPARCPLRAWAQSAALETVPASCRTS